MRHATSRPEHGPGSDRPTGPERRPGAADSRPAPEHDPRPDEAARARWAETAREIERLNQADPLAGVARAERWLAEEPGGEGRARALRSLAYALRVSGQYE